MTITSVPVRTSSENEHEPGVAGAEAVLLTVAFTDLQDFVIYTEAEGDDAASRLLISHHRESGAIVRSRGGCVLKRLGDGLMLAFPEPEAAVLACLELGEVAPLPMRAGVHRGNVVATLDDLIGHAVNLAARVTESASGGELIVTGDVRAAVGDLRGVAFDGPHSRSFKGIAKQVPVYFASRDEGSPANRAVRRLMDGDAHDHTWNRPHRSDGAGSG